MYNLKGHSSDITNHKKEHGIWDTDCENRDRLKSLKHIISMDFLSHKHCEHYKSENKYFGHEQEDDEKRFLKKKLKLYFMEGLTTEGQCKGEDHEHKYTLMDKSTIQVKQ